MILSLPSGSLGNTGERTLHQGVGAVLLIDAWEHSPASVPWGTTPRREEFGDRPRVLMGGAVSSVVGVFPCSCAVKRASETPVAGCPWTSGRGKQRLTSKSSSTDSASMPTTIVTSRNTRTLEPKNHTWSPSFMMMPSASVQLSRIMLFSFCG
jgi:hypothetical protein